MPRATKLLPSEIPDWPDPVRGMSPLTPRHVRTAGVLLAHWIRQVNEALAEDGRTQADLAKMSGVGLRTVSRVLRGGAWPELPTIVAMSSAVRVPLPGEGDLARVDPLCDWPTCWQCDAELERDHPDLDAGRDAEPQAMFEVVTRVHGTAWTGVRCGWMEELRSVGCVPGTPPVWAVSWPDDPAVLHNPGGTRPRGRAVVWEALTLPNEGPW